MTRSRSHAVVRSLLSLAAALTLLGTAPVGASDNLPHDEEAAIHQVLEDNGDAYRLAHAEATKLMEGIDWTGVDRLRIELDDNLFEPEDVYLKLHRPYRITLVNIGFESHDIAGEAFFSSFIIKKVRNASIEVDAFHLERLLIRPKEEIELWLVPTRVSRLDFVCTIPGHLEEGMAGHLVIRD
jgi:uncharacterized cupredoxin-like copper-binding protein